MQKRVLKTVLLVSLPVFLLIFGCSKFQEVTGFPPRKIISERDSGDYAKEPMEYLEEAPAPEPSVSGLEGDGAFSPVSTGSRVQLEEKRKKIYSGYTELLVDDIEQSKGIIGNLAEERGGYVESAYGNTIVIRVPAVLFESVMDEIFTFGEARHHYVETLDVTEYFQDLDTRLSIAEKARERLYILLEKTDDVEERVNILREIRRLTEEIERIKGLLESIKRRIRFSRITVDLLSRLEEYALEIPDIPFPWIAGLDPLYPSIPHLKGRVYFPLEDDFAVFGKEDYFRAESADLVRVRVGTLENIPRGDSEFWQRALLFHLEPYYASVEPFSFDHLKGIVLESKDGDPFYYAVGAGVVRNRLYVVEVFFPDRKVYQEKKGTIMDSLSRFRAGREE